MRNVLPICSVISYLGIQAPPSEAHARGYKWMSANLTSLVFREDLGVTLSHVLGLLEVQANGCCTWWHSPPGKAHGTGEPVLFLPVIVFS